MPTLPSFHHVLVLSIVIRVGLIVYSEWHDAHSVVKYTDIDYRVFSDAARFLLNPGPDTENHAEGPLGRLLGVNLAVGDPYTRETYRYTPLLALLLAPNEWLHPSFGKYLFAACDIFNGVLIYDLLLSLVLPKSAPAREDSTLTRKDLATIYSALHLLNPLVFAISTRGSSESVLSLFVLLTLYAALKGRWDAAAVALGLSTHWKIYPVIYGVACLGVIGGSASTNGWKSYFHSLFNLRTIRFAVLSASTFFGLGAGCYLVWGYPFLFESYLYHLHRLDHRHNFSPYFYLIYLTYPSLEPSVPVVLPVWRRVLRTPLTSFGPQMALALGAGFAFGRRKDDLVFAWFVQTVVFVVFNKVCTSQYFLWYLLLFPLLLPRLSMARWKAITYAGVWMGTQALWLSEAYKLEFLGDNVFFGLWVRGLVYVVGNCWVLAGIMDGYNVSQKIKV
ncbi:glycosyltransferase family 50 protein [Mycena maculata]|uniref:GPI mannosyltransferase 1 n=1 Tax=Mycena maculata TaxID=230809 RepID=A0AAD7N1K1_9AGAR|nr:glycosyltransferase family 50 protein [Mycena maculata]